MTSIYDLSWKKTSFFHKLFLFACMMWNDIYTVLIDTVLDHHIFGYPDDMDTARARWSAMSSTCYSIASSCYSRVKPVFCAPWYSFWLVAYAVWCLVTWVPLGAICFLDALLLSNKVVEGVEIGELTPEMLDVRQSILLRWGMLDEARTCIRVALAMNPDRAHTRGLLHVGLAETYLPVISSSSYFVQKHVLIAAIEAINAVEEGEYNQASRIYKQSSKIAKQLTKHYKDYDCPLAQSEWREYSVIWGEESEKLARKSGADDQLMKIAASK